MSRNKRLFLLVDAMEVAALGLRVESGQVGQAVDGLERLTGAAERAERSTDGLSKGAESARKSSDRLGKSADASAKSVTNLAQMASRAGVTLGAALSVTLLKDYADSWSDMQSQVGAAVKNMGAAPALMQRIVDIANASYSPLQQTAAIYAQNVSVLEELGRSAQEAADFTESLNHMLVITATKGQQAEAVQGALSRAMAVGKLSGMGLETVLASGGRVAEALAKELGTTTNGLRAMAAQGKITSDVIANAIVNSLQDVRKEADEMPATVGDAFQRIQTNLTEFVGVLDQATGSSGAIAQGLIGVADAIRTTSKYASTFAALAAPAFDMVGSAVSAVAGYADMAVVALAGFYAPAMMGGLSLLTTSLSVGLVGALRAVTAAMLANPIGLLVGALVTAGYAVYKFRDQIHEAIGVDVVQTAKTAANYIIGSFVAAYEDLKFVFGNFGSIVGGAIVGGVNVAIRAVNGLIQGVTSRLDSFVESINETFGTGMKMIGGSAAIQEMVNPYADAVAAALEERGKKISEALSRDYLGELAAGFKKATLVIGGSTETIKNNSRSLVDNSKKLTEAAKAAKKFAEERVAAFQKQREGISDLQKERRALEDQITTFGQSKRAIEQLTISRLREQAAVLAGFAGSEEAIELLRLEIEERERLLQAGFTLDGLERGKKAADDLAETAKRTHDDIEKSLTDALLRGFESGKGFGRNFIDTLKNMFSSLVLRPIIQPIAAGAAGMITGALGFGGAANAKGGQGAAMGFDVLRGAHSAYSAFTGGLTSTLSNGIGYLGEMFGSSALQSFAAGMSGSAVSSAFAAASAAGVSATVKGVAGLTSLKIGSGVSASLGTSAATGAAASGSMGAGATFGAALPWIGGALAVASVASMVHKAFKGETRGGGYYQLNQETMTAARLGGASGGDGGKQTLDAITQSFVGTQTQIEGVFKALGVDASVAFFEGMFEDSKKGRGGVFSGGILDVGGQQINFGTNKKGAGYGGKSGSLEEMFENLQKDLAFTTLEAWQVVSDQMPSIIGDMLTGLDVRSLSAEQAQAAVDQIQGIIIEVQQLTAALDTLPMLNLQNLAFDVVAGITQMFGGADRAVEGIGAYYQEYYSEAERAAHTTKLLTDAFGRLGYEMPASRDALRDIIDGIDVTTREGQELYARLVQLAPTFASVTDATAGLNDNVESIQRLMSQIAQLPFSSLALLGEDAVRSLAAMGGGVEAFSNGLSGFYQGFYSESERQAQALLMMSTELRDLNQVFPSTKDGFRDLVHGLDLSTEAGQKLYASLMGMSGAAAGFYDYVAQKSEASFRSVSAEITASRDEYLKSLQTRHQAAQKAIRDEYAAKSQAIRNSITSVNEKLRDLNGVFSALDTGIKSLREQSALASQLQRDVSLRVIDDAIKASKAGKSLSGFADLQDSISSVSKLDANNFTSLFDFELERAETVTRLKELEALTGGQIDVQELQLDSLNKQIEQLSGWQDRQLELLQKQHESAQNRAHAQFEKMLADEKARFDAELTQMMQQQANQLLINDSITAGSLSTAHGLSAVQSAIDASASRISSAVSNMRINVSMPSFTGLNLPAFADGGYYRGGLALVGERGPEIINFSKPGMVYTNAQSQNLLGGGGDDREMLKLMNQLISMLSNVSYETRAVAVSVAKLLDVLKDVTQGGTELRTTVVS